MGENSSFMDSIISKETAMVLGQAIFYSAIQASIASCLNSSVFSIHSFGKDQETLQNAADALRHYIVVGAIWGLASMLVLYAQHGWCGFWLGFLANFGFITWITYIYWDAFEKVAKKYNLKMPHIFPKW